MCCVGLYIDSQYKSWPTSVATIKHSYLRGKVPEVRYEYIVDDKKYYSKQANIGSSYVFGKEKAHTIINNNKKDSEVLVNYWPRFPSVSILDPGYQRLTMYFCIIRSITVLSGTYILMA